MSTRISEQGSFTASERAALKERAKEVKEAARLGSMAQKSAEAEQAVLERIASMTGSDRAIAERSHEVITSAAPSLAPRLWYGMPAYALDGKVLCFIQSGEKFNARYVTLGFSDQASLDDGAMWAASFALTEISPEVEDKIELLVLKALGQTQVTNQA